MGAARKKRLCIYCNCWSVQPRDVGRWWDCSKCESRNWLDEKGESTDPPPVIDTPPPKRYAERPLRGSSPDLQNTQTFVFCQRCLTNQQIYTRAIAEYFPDEEDPKYAKFERGFDAYKKRLEEQYPQVCAKCEPLARAKMNAVSREVRQNHLSQCLQWTREKMGAAEPFQWMAVPHLLGGTMWITSIAVQLLWHSFYATKATEIYGRDGLLDVDDTVYTQIVRYALYLGLAACWWNPKMGRKPIKARNKLLGLFEYYRLQLVYLAFRTAAWRAVSVGFRDVKSTQAINALALVVIVSLSIISWRMVAWDSQPKINWTITDEPLVESKSITSENDDRPFRPLPSSNPPNHLIQPRQHPVHLNINDFGRRVEPKQHVQQVPTPPNEEEDDPDSMDWAPSQSHVFSPMKDFRSSRQSSRSTMPVSTERSPFYGTLPANPRSQAAKLRNPRPVERPIEITPGPRDNLFGKGKETDDDSVMSISTTTSPAKFAPQRFFAAGDDAETGLESMFSNAFRMKEEHAPEEQSKETEQSNTFDLQPERKSSQDLSYKVWAKLFRLMSLLLICILWINAEAAAPSFGYIRGVCLIVAAVVIASRIGTSGSLVSQFGLGVETLILVYIGSSFIYPNIQLSWYLPTQTDDLGFWFLFSLLGQEIWISFFMAAPSSVGELTEQGHQAASPPRHPWHYEKEVEPSPPPSPLPNQFGSPGLGGPPPVPSHHSTSGHTNLRPQLGFASPTPSFFAFGNTHKSITPHLSQPTPRWEGNYRLRPDVQPPFGPSRSGYSVSNDVVAPRRSTRTQGGKTHSLGGAGGLGGLSLGD